MSTRFLKITVTPTVVWDDDENLTEVLVQPMVVHGPDVEEFFFDGKIADELKALVEAVEQQFNQEN